MTPHLTTAPRQGNKTFQNTHVAKSNKRLPVSTALLILLILFIVAVGAFVTTPSSSAASAKKLSNASALLPPPSVALADMAGLIRWDDSKSDGLIKAQIPRLMPLAPVMRPVTPLPPQAATPAIATFASDCTTPKSSWNLGETVCVQVSGIPLSAAFTLRRIELVSPSGFVIDSADITSSSQSFNFTLPANATQTFFGNTLDNRGTWNIAVVDTADASVRDVVGIVVHDQAQPVSDLQISKTLIGTSVNAGSNVSYLIFITNQGPDSATNVHFTDNTLPNTTFVSLEQTSGPTFNCTPPSAGTSGTTNCTKASMAADERASFIVTYLVSGSVGNGAELTDTSGITSETFDQYAASNNTDVNTTVSNPTTSTCTLTCPGNVTATADTTEDVDGMPTSGAHVTFSAAETSGSCGTVTASIPSGSFFPVGSTPVTVSSSDGGSCSFIVTVTSSGSAVTIACPSDINVNADSNCQATVTLGTPTTTGDNVTVTSSRSDGKPLTAPFSSGVTIVSWTAANSSGTESCNQKVTVNDVTPPTITIAAPAPASADANCQAAIPDLTGEAHVVDNCGCDSSDDAEDCTGRVPITVTQSPAPGTLVGLGPHTITLTANDGSSNNNGAGNTATITVTFTVNDTTAPAFTFVPPSVTAYTGAGGTSCATVISNATLGTATASDNCQTASVTRSPSGNTFPVGTTTVIWTATDGSGNTTTATQAVTVIDNTPPTISCPTNITVYLPLNTTATSMNVSYPPATATDNCAGPISIGYSAASGSVFQVGTTSVTATATDAHSNSASCTFTVTVLYDFTGFFSPVGNLPTLNQVNAGRAIPVKFSLSGNKGLSILLAGYPLSQQIACDSGAPVSDVVETVTAGNSSLGYSPDQYSYIWKTESSWAGTCRQLVIKLNDGTTHSANFKFK
jgi:uncharacterized repeat protein (TIGR01451 family)